MIQPRNRGGNIDKLNPQQQSFVHHLLADDTYSLSAAARKAGYKFPNVLGSKLINNPIILRAIGKEMAKRHAELDFTADQVLAQLKTALQIDPLEFFEPLGNGLFSVKDLDKVPEAARRCVTKLKQRAKYNKNGDMISCHFILELMSKDAMMALAMKYFKLAGEAGVSVNLNGDAQVLINLLNRVEKDNNIVDAKFIEAPAQPVQK